MSLSKQSIQETINQLKVMQEQLNDSCEHIVEDFVEAGKDYIQRNYESTNTDIINEDWRVDSEINGKNGKVFSKGSSVIYMEFGTGDIGKNAEQNPKRYDFALNDFNSGKRIKTDEAGNHYWIYNHEIQRGIPAGCQVYKASQKLRQNAVSAAKEIVRDDLRLR